jgi:hypothetical protein
MKLFGGDGGGRKSALCDDFGARGAVHGNK